MPPHFLPYTKLSAKKSLNPVAIPHRKSVYIGVRHERQRVSGKEEAICCRCKQKISVSDTYKHNLSRKGGNKYVAVLKDLRQRYLQATNEQEGEKNIMWPY